MDKLSAVLEHLKQLPRNFWGNVIIRYKEGKPTLITEEKTIRLDENQENDKRR